MSRIKIFVLLLCAVVSPLFVGCESKESEPVEAPVMVLDTDHLSVEGGGGEVPIFYTMQNARKGVLPSVKSNVEWMTVKSIASSYIMLDVEASDIDEERAGVVTISYTGMKRSLKVYVTQSKQPLNKFSFEVFDVTHNSCSVKYIPQQSGGYFMANIIDSEYFVKSGIYDMDDFIYAEMSNYLALAAQHNITLESLLTEKVSPQLIFDDEAIRHYKGMQSGATYVAYAYGLELKDNEYTVTIPLHQVSIDIPMSTVYDVSFRISPQIRGGVLTVAIEPNGWRGYYTVNLIPENSLYYIPQGEYITEYTFRAMSNEFYQRARKAMQSGMSAETFLHSQCYIGSQSVTTPVESGTNYMIVVYAVESVDGAIPTVCSMASVAYI